MKVLLVAEGEHELNPGGESCALEEIVRQLLPSVTAIDRRLLRDRVRLAHLTSIRGKKGAHQKTLMLWIRSAEIEGYDAIIAVIDEDGVVDRRKAVEDLQDSPFSAMPRALGLAIRTFDAWMLTDEVVIGTVLGVKVQRQKAPESLKEPKKVFEELLRSANEPCSQREAYLKISRILNLDQVAQRCPKGFAAFKTRMEKLAANQ